MAGKNEAFIRNKYLRILPHLNQGEAHVFFCLNSWTGIDNRTGWVAEGTIAGNCNLTRRGVIKIIQRLEAKKLLSHYSEWAGAQRGIHFCLFPNPSPGVMESPRQSSGAFKNLKSFEFPYVNGTESNSERDRVNSERDRVNSERDRVLMKKPNNWVSISKEHIHNLSGNALKVYAIMLTHNSRKWTHSELIEFTGLCYDSMSKALEELIPKYIIKSEDGYIIKDPPHKKNFPKHPEKPLEEQKVRWVVECGVVGCPVRGKYEHGAHKGV